MDCCRGGHGGRRGVCDWIGVKAVVSWDLLRRSNSSERQQLFQWSSSRNWGRASGLLTNVGRVSGPKSSNKRHSSGQWRPSFQWFRKNGGEKAWEGGGIWEEGVSGRWIEGQGGSRDKVRRTSDGDKSNKFDQSKEKRNSIDALQWQNLTVQERDHPGQKTGLRRQWNWSEVKRSCYAPPCASAWVDASCFSVRTRELHAFSFRSPDFEYRPILTPRFPLRRQWHYQVTFILWPKNKPRIWANGSDTM